MQENLTVLIQEYDEILTHKRTNFSGVVCTGSQTQNEKLVIDFYRIIFDQYLHWTPMEVVNCLTYNILCELKISQLLTYIKFPPEINYKQDCYYLAGLLYPKFRMSKRDRCIKIYQDVLDGKLSKFPKNFFSGIQGQEYAGICLRYILSRTMQVNTPYQIYEYFYKNGRKYLSEHFLHTACYDNWDSDLDYLHENLSPKQQDENALHYFKSLRKLSKAYKSLAFTDRFHPSMTIKDLRQTKAYELYVNRASLPKVYEEDILHLLFCCPEWRHNALICFSASFVKETKHHNWECFDDILDFLLSEDGDKFFTDNSLDIPLKRFGSPIIYFGFSLPPAVCQENKEMLLYAERMAKKKLQK